MLDLKFIRENPDVVRKAIENRHDSAPLDEILKLDIERRQKVIELEEARRSRKQASRERQADAAEEGRASPGDSTARMNFWTRPLTLVNVPRFSACAHPGSR
mgnify:CR=1 FL=1